MTFSKCLKPLGLNGVRSGPPLALTRSNLVGVLACRRLADLRVMDSSSKLLQKYLQHLATSEDPALENKSSYLVVAGRPIAICRFCGTAEVVVDHDRGPGQQAITWITGDQVAGGWGQYGQASYVSLAPLFRRVDEVLAQDVTDPQELELEPEAAEATG